MLERVLRGQYALEQSCIVLFIEDVRREDKQVFWGDYLRTSLVNYVEAEGRACQPGQLRLHLVYPMVLCRLFLKEANQQGFWSQTT